MSEAAIQYAPGESPSPSAALVGALTRAGLKLPSREIVILAAVMALLQVLDGVLTAIGVTHLGTAAEGNVLIRHLMQSIGALPALAIVKGFAILVVGMLCLLAGTVAWLGAAFRYMICLYFGAAILPWSALLVTKFFI